MLARITFLEQYATRFDSCHAPYHSMPWAFDRPRRFSHGTERPPTLMAQSATNYHENHASRSALFLVERNLGRPNCAEPDVNLAASE
jgi:hypothetical protein